MFLFIVIGVPLFLLIAGVIEHSIRWRWREKHKYDLDTDEHGRG